MSEVYLGNPNLKKANTPIEFTQENIVEFLKCKDDPVYFANNYIKIVSLDEGLVPFKQYPFQKKLIASHDKPLFKSVPATGVRGDQPASDILKRLVNPVKSGTPMNPFGVKV